MKTKKWLIVRKKEMTKLRLDNRHTAVTLLEVVPQEVVRYKTLEKDGYEAVVLGVGKKELNKEKWQKISYALLREFWYDEAFQNTYASWAALSAEILDDVTEIDITGTSKGKGYQGAMKRFWLSGGPKTHGSKFHRHIGWLGNRKPRRVQKGHPHAGHMGNETVTLHSRPVVEKITLQWVPYIAVKGSVPGTYNGYLSVYVG